MLLLASFSIFYFNLLMISSYQIMLLIIPQVFWFFILSHLIFHLYVLILIFSYLFYPSKFSLAIQEQLPIEPHLLVFLKILFLFDLFLISISIFLFLFPLNSFWLFIVLYLHLYRHWLAINEYSNFTVITIDFMQLISCFFYLQIFLSPQM